MAISVGSRFLWAPVKGVMSARSKSQIEISNNSEGFLFSETGYLKFTPNSKNLFAASQDGLIYKFDYNPSSGLSNMLECTNQLLSLNERIGKISVSNCGHVAVASESNELVRLYKMKEDGKFDEAKLVTKCAGFTDALAINPAGTILCCSGKDNNVKVINIKDPEFPVLNQIPSDHFVRSICFSESGSNFAMLQVDGVLKVFKIVENNPAPQLVKTLIGPKSGLEAKLQMSWKGNVLGVLYDGSVLRIYNTVNWAIKAEMSLIEPALHFELVSKNAALISCKNGDVLLYSIAQNKILTSVKYAGDLSKCSIAAADEQFACVFNSEKSDLFSMKLVLHYDDLQEIKPEVMETKKKSKKNKSSFVVDEVEEDAEEEEEEQEELGLDISEEEEGEDLGDSDSERSADEDEEEEEEGSVNESEIGSNGLNAVVKVFKHPVVQPCCTPWRNLQRYLAYNNVGFITARRQLDESENLINYDIEFMDRTAHNPIRFSDLVSYSIAAIHEKGAVFAAGSERALKYVSFENSEDSWTASVSIEPILVGINVQSVFVINNCGILNIYSRSGLLRASVTCPGRPISLVCPDDNEIFLFTEDYEGILCHRIDARTGGVSKGSQASRVLLGSEKQQLTWVGLSFSGVLGAFSSAGKLSLLLTGGDCDRWTEFLDTSKTLGDKLEQAWPVYFDVNVLSAVVCNYIEKFPDPYPAPHVIDFNFCIPELSTETAYEEIVRTNWIVNETVSTGLSEREKKKLFASADRHLLELAQISIKSNQYSRLSDLATWASNEKTLDLLIQLAGHYKLVAIVAEIEMIKLNKFKPADITINSSNPNTSNTSNVNTNNAVSTATTAAWSTPKLPELVAKESPSGILANLTPMKTTGVVNAASEPAIVSSPAELAPSPTIQANPFAKNNENANPAAASTAPVKDGSAMLDYISAMMKMNESSGNNKRKADDSANANAVKKSALGSNVFTSNTQ